MNVLPSTIQAQLWTLNERQLQQQLTEAQSRIARLEEAAQVYSESGFDDYLFEVLAESPRQSLDHIKREAMEKFRKVAVEELESVDSNGEAFLINSLPLPIDKEVEW